MLSSQVRFGRLRCQFVAGDHLSCRLTGPWNGRVQDNRGQLHQTTAKTGETAVVFRPHVNFPSNEEESDGVRDQQELLCCRDKDPGAVA